MRVTVKAEDAGSRLDVFLAKVTGYTRSHVGRWLQDGLVSPGYKPSRRVAEAETFQIDIPAPKETEWQAEDIPLDILYEDEDILVVNKPAGLVVHPAAGNETGTLVHALLHHCTDLSGINGKLRPGIVHRLDKDTSGTMVVAKNDFAHISLAAQIEKREMKRVYWALVRGRVKPDEGTIDAPIARHPVDRKRMAVRADGRKAVTHFQVIERMTNATFVECRLETGRTHQIRVHMRSIGHPVLNDPVYAPASERKHATGQMLHARMLSLIHPRTGERVSWVAKPPEAWVKRLKREGGRALQTELDMGSQNEKG